MRIIANNLSWILTEMSNLCLKRLSLVGLGDLVQVDTVFIGERVEDIHVLYGVFSSLLVPVYQVNPLVNPLRNPSSF